MPQYQRNTVDTDDVNNQKLIICPICKSSQFDERTAMLNTKMLTFFNLDWADDTAYLLVCKECDNIIWFNRAPARIENT